MTTETTEWDDILREKGILPEITQEQIEEIVDQVVLQHQNGKEMKDRDLDELNEIEDEDLEDDRVFESFRRARIKAMQQESKNEIYGSVIEFSKSDYTAQVTDASKSVWVVVILYQSYIPESKLLLALMERLSQKYKTTKFLKIRADLCIENYPDKNVPTLLIYGQGDLKQQIVGLAKFGASNTNLENIEIVLKGIGALGQVSSTWSSRDLEEEQEEGGGDASKFKMNYIGKKVGGKESDDDDWD